MSVLQSGTDTGKNRCGEGIPDGSWIHGMAAAPSGDPLTDAGRGPGVRRRIGIMGGTFDPIHIGHLILGESAYGQFGLDKVLFMPSGNPPHKRHRDGATNRQRVDMVRLAIDGNEHFELSLEEMHEEGYTYTKETLARLTREHPDTDYYFIMGADSLLYFDTWKCPEKIAALCTLVVAVRDGLPSDRLDEEIRRISRKYHADIRKLTSPNLDIASHTIRNRIRNGESIRYYVPESVRRYIFENGVYHSCSMTTQRSSTS